MAGDRPGINVPALPYVEHILLDTAGRQHVIARTAAGLAQISIGGCNALVGPVTLGLDLSRREEIAAAAQGLAVLAGALRGPRIVAGEPSPWTAHTLRLRDALIALDCRRSGAKLREIAIAIYGRDRIEREWPGNGLRKRVRRDVERGLALSNGGYRGLLR